jgi:hypothetical protein
MLNIDNGQSMCKLFLPYDNINLRRSLRKKNRRKSGNVPTSFDVCMELDFCFTVFLSISVETVVVAAGASQAQPLSHMYRNI